MPRQLSQDNSHHTTQVRRKRGGRWHGWGEAVTFPGGGLEKRPSGTQPPRATRNETTHWKTYGLDSMLHFATDRGLSLLRICFA